MVLLTAIGMWKLRHWTKPWRHVMPIKAGLVSYKHNNVAPFVGSRCNKFEHDLCPGPSKSVLSKFLTCYLNITFQSRCRHKQGVNKNTREKQLHSLADTDCWPIGAVIKFVKLKESKNALCNFPEFFENHRKRKPTWMFQSFWRLKRVGMNKKTLFIALADVDTIVDKDWAESCAKT